MWPKTIQQQQDRWAGVPPSPWTHCQPVWVWSRDRHPSSQSSRDTKTSDIPLQFPAALDGLVAVVRFPDVWLRQQTLADALGPWPDTLWLWAITLCYGPVWAARGAEDPHQLLPPCLLPAPSPSHVSASSFHHTANVSSLGSKNNPWKRTTVPSSTAVLRLMLPEPEGGDAPKSPGSTRQTQPCLSALRPIGAWLSTHSSLSLLS